MLARQTILLAQLVAQYLNLGKFNKEDHYVDQKNQNALLSCIGIILVWSKADNSEQSTTICTIDNIWHDCIKPTRSYQYQSRQYV